jgi:excisionase family DNA binding protein
MAAPEPQKLMNIEQLADRLSLSVAGVRKMIKRRVIPVIKLGYKCMRFRWADVDAALSRVTVRAV